ncbi:thiamine-phosphate kinase [Trichothermofontia sp.]
MREPCVRDFGEQGVLQRLFPYCSAGMVGDDAAVLAGLGPQSLVVAADVLVEGVHFSDRTTPAAAVGWRAAAANLSDLAAMGAMSLGITIALAMPSEVPIAWIESLYGGITACLNAYGGVILGGDLSQSPVRSIAITALGQVEPERVLRRSVAQAGDAIVVTGLHGLSRLGLAILLDPRLGERVSGTARDRWLRAHQYPVPRLDVIDPLWQVVAQTQCRSAIAAMDSSDGLADAIVQICRASGVGAKVERQRLGIPPEATAIADPQQVLEWVLYGGEDFELVLCLPPATAEGLVQRLGGDAAIVGEVTADPGVFLADGAEKIPLSLAQGFQHF